MAAFRADSEEDSPGLRRAWGVIAVAAFALAGWKAVALAERCSATRSARHTTAAAGPRTVGVPIERVALGDRVPGANPAEQPDRRYGDEVDPATWRRVDLRCPKRDGTWADVALLRPAAWLEEHKAAPGGRVVVAVPECGIDGDGEVLAVGPCPPIKPGPGNVVTGTFRHHNARVIDVSVEGQADPIGTTPNHKFWSEDRRAFVRADGLRAGEAVVVLNGGTARVSATSDLRGPVDVYNIETYPWHTYHVANAGILVHNAGPGPTPAPSAVPPVVYHYTNAAGAANIASKGLWAGSSVTADLYPTPQAASQALGIPAKDATHVIAIENTGQFRPLQGGVVQPSNRYGGGGSQFTNRAAVPPGNVLGTFSTGGTPPPLRPTPPACP